ncbi:hypothetical protein IAT38_007872 [Cryptococcus sp. DSM 104549]
MPPPTDISGIEDSPERSPELLAHSSLPEITPVPEVSMVEESTVTGVSFTPELWMQRRHWALETLRKENVRSVLDIGCGPGALLETLVMAPSTVREPPILPKPTAASDDAQLPSPVDSDAVDGLEQEREIFLSRLGGLDASPDVIVPALAVLSAPSAESSFPPARPRWQPLTTELWLGGIEKYNAKLEGYEAIVALEVIEHLDPNVLSRFGVVTLGTYRPRLLLVSTPNFDFNSKFPRANTEEGFAKKGFVDPTGRTDRVFRHSDHKCEMTSREFREWAEAAAADWGYNVEVSGVGASSHPSFYPSKDPSRPPEPIFASQTAIFRIGTGLPLRSPRSVRTIQLPFMPASKESSHPHKLASRQVHPICAPGTGQKDSPDDVRARVRAFWEGVSTEEITLDELWGSHEIAGACAGSKRWLVGCLGGWGDCAPVVTGDEFEVRRRKGKGFTVRWRDWAPKAPVKEEEWGTPMDGVEAKEDADGW